MAFGYLLEDGSGRLLLEDASGIYLLEDAAVVAALITGNIAPIIWSVLARRAGRG